MVECIDCAYTWDILRMSGKHRCADFVTRRVIPPKSRTIRPAIAVTLDPTGHTSKSYMRVSGEVTIHAEPYQSGKIAVTLKGPTEDIMIYCKEFTLGAPEDL